MHAALVAVNAWGDVVGTPEADLIDPQIPAAEAGFGHSGNTTIGVVATNAVASKTTCMHMARGAHDGLARAISPPHASVDGDAFVALATGAVPAAADQLRWMAVQAVQQAILAVGTDSAHR
ncbi:MAG: P1 family peptidase [Microthrixaceae bacterium]